MTLRSACFLLGIALAACGGHTSNPDDERCPLDCDPVTDGGRAAHGGGAAGRLPQTSGAGGVLGDAGPEAAPGGAAGERGAGALDDGGQGGDTGLGGGVSTGGTCGHHGARFATGVVDHAFGGGQNHNQGAAFPAAVLGPPVANDPGAVVSLGNGGWVVLEFSDDAIVDGPGVDFTVFENPLGTFKELATVAVSDDARHWIEFPCTAAQDAADLGFCAGVSVVFSSPNNGLDPLDPAVSGGDHYDLSDIHLSHARYVRITDRVDLTGLAGVFDLDAVGIVNAECP